MFVKGEYVFHETGGICRIVDIQAAPLEGMPLDRVYYIIKPVHDPNSTIYLPIDSDRIFLRRGLTREEALALFNRIPVLDEIEETNPKQLRAKYAELMQTHSPEAWVRIIKTVSRRIEQAGNSRAQRVSDFERSIMESAKRYLYTELALALELDVDRVEDFIATHFQKTV